MSKMSTLLNGWNILPCNVLLLVPITYSLNYKKYIMTWIGECLEIGLEINRSEIKAVYISNILNKVIRIANEESENTQECV